MHATPFSSARLELGGPDEQIDRLLAEDDA